MKALLAIALAACGTNSVSLPLVAPGQPKLFAYEIDYGPWQSPSGHYDGDTTTYDLELDGDYALALVCVDPDGTYHGVELYGTLDDAPITIGAWELPDCRPPPPVPTDPGPMVEVTADILDASHFALDGNNARIAPTLPWEVATSVAPGRHDVILWGDSAMRIVRDVAFDMSRNELGTLAVSEASSAFVGRPYDVPVVGDEMATTVFQLTTANGTVMQYLTSPDAAYFPPASVLLDSDTRRFELFVYDYAAGTQRGALFTNFPETPPDVDLLPVLQPPSLDRSGVRLHWTPFAEFFTSATIEYTDQTGSLSASASKLWLDRHAGADLVFDELDVPHYDPSWDVTAPAVKFTVERWSPGETLFTSTPQGYLERPGAR